MCRREAEELEKIIGNFICSIKCLPGDENQLPTDICISERFLEIIKTYKRYFVWIPVTQKQKKKNRCILL